MPAYGHAHQLVTVWKHIEFAGICRAHYVKDSDCRTSSDFYHVITFDFRLHPRSRTSHGMCAKKLAWETCQLCEMIYNLIVWSLIGCTPDPGCCITYMYCQETHTRACRAIYCGIMLSWVRVLRYHNPKKVIVFTHVWHSAGTTKLFLAFSLTLSDNWPWICSSSELLPITAPCSD